MLSGFCAKTKRFQPARIANRRVFFTLIELKLFFSDIKLYKKISLYSTSWLTATGKHTGYLFKTDVQKIGYKITSDRFDYSCFFSIHIITSFPPGWLSDHWPYNRTAWKKISGTFLLQARMVCKEKLSFILTWIAVGWNSGQDSNRCWIIRS